MRIRKLSVERLHKAFGDATLEWPNASPTTGLSHYTVKFGVPHLLVTQRAGDAIQQMLNLRYMVALLLAYGESKRQPLRYWRALGMRELRTAWLGEMENGPGDSTEDHMWAWARFGDFSKAATMPDLADRAYANAELIAEDTTDSPRVRASLMHRRGTLALNNREPEKAQSLLREAVRLRTLALGEDDEVTLSSVFDLGRSLQALGQLQEAEECLSRVYQSHRTNLGPDAMKTLVVRGDLGGVLAQSGRREAAKAHLEAVAMGKEKIAPNASTTLRSWNNLASFLQDEGDLKRAESIYLRCLAASIGELGEEQWESIAIRNNLATLYGSRGEYDSAAQQLNAAYRFTADQLGQTNPNTLMVQKNLGSALFAAEQFDESKQHLETVWSGLTERLPPGHPILVQVASKLCEVHLKTNAPVRCQPLVAHIHQALETAPGEPHPKVVLQANNLASLLLDAGQAQESGSLYRRCLHIWADSTDWKHHWARLGCSLCDALESGDFSLAEAVLSDLIALLGEDHERITKGREKIVLIRQKALES